MNTVFKTYLSVWFYVIFILGNCIQSFSQVPQGIQYQAIARDSSGSVLQNTTVTTDFIIHDNTITGTIVYAESQSLSTNQFGLYTAVIGAGTVSSGTFSTIAWGSGSKFLEVKINGTSIAVTQLQSVPYALYAATAGSSVGNTATLYNTYNFNSTSGGGDSPGVTPAPLSLNFITYNKQQVASTLEITFQGILYVQSLQGGANAAYFEIRVDGKAPTDNSGRAIISDSQLDADMYYNFTAVFTNLSAGSHRIQLFGYSDSGNAVNMRVNQQDLKNGAVVIVKEQF